MMRRSLLRQASGPQANPFESKLLSTMKVDGGEKKYFQINKLDNYASLPFSIRVLLESAVRNCDEFEVTQGHVEKILDWQKNCTKQIEIPFKPARVILQDFTGVPCVVDLAAMRDAMVALGGDPNKINPQIPVDLVIDHSVQVDASGTPDSLQKNSDLEMERNRERFAFLKWGSKAFENLRIVPPSSGIVHQVNLEYIAPVTMNRNGYLYPDSVVGTDSHTTMINGLGVLGWGVGGIEAEAAMLGQSQSLVLPQVLGYKLTGRLREGVTATDVVLTCTRNLRKLGVVGKFVEYYGEGYKSLSLADRATMANMAPEYGATMGYCPIDEETLKFMEMTGRKKEHIERVKNYTQSIGLWTSGDEQIQYSQNLELDLSTVEPCVAGPKRPHDHVSVRDMPKDFHACLRAKQGFKGFGVPSEDHHKKVHYTMDGEEREMVHGSVVIAAITSCTNTSNPTVLMAAGLLAKKAVEKGLKISPQIKTSLSPGSHVVTEYLEAAGLQKYLDQLGFNTTGYGCMTCIGNSGDIHPDVSKAIAENNMVAAAVLSGNRNFEARVHPQTAGNYLASPPLVVAYALAGRVDFDFEKEPLADGVYLRDLWPTNEEIVEVVKQNVHEEFFERIYSTIETHNEAWNKLEAPEGSLYKWDEKSTYIHNPPYFSGMKAEPVARGAIKDAACLLYLGDSVTTDHISPAGNIAKNSPAAIFLETHGVKRNDYNTYGSRRGNDLIMTRGTFANTRLGNKIIGDGQTGPWTIHQPTGDKLAIFDAAMRYKEEGTPTIVLAGKEYGSGSSRDWAAKGPFLQGIRAVIAESYERIHRSNLVGMGVVPLQFMDGDSAESLDLTGREKFNFNLPEKLVPGQEVEVTADFKKFKTILRIDTAVEVKFFEHGGILQYVLRSKLQN